MPTSNAITAAASQPAGRGSKRVLMIAYHFPPLAGSSGIQRTLRFVSHLPRFGWEPIVLTAHPRAYATTSNDLLADVPSNVRVERAFALDASRHLAIAGRYPTVLGDPDRWVTWLVGAVPAGLRLIRRFQPDLIWSTFPIATAHVIGATLRRFSKLPWVADFRDPMAQDNYPPDPRIWRSFMRIEQRAVREAAACCFTTPGALRLYRERYGDTAAARFQLIENGYDESSFESVPASRGPLVPGKLTLVHSGNVYPSERDPTALFRALAMLKANDAQRAENLVVRFRAADEDTLLAKLAAENGVAEMIEIVPAVPYREALTEMISADGLLLLQASNCNDQIPAKYYEYLRAGRPIFALTDTRGDTGAAMISHGLDVAAPLHDAEAIAAALHRFVTDPAWRQRLIASPPVVASTSREARAERLAGVFDAVAQPKAARGRVSNAQA